MLKKCKKRAFIFFVVLSFFISNVHFNSFLMSYVYALPSSVTVKGTTVNVRSGPGTNYKILGTVNLGYKISPIDTEKDASSNGKSWYRFIFNGQKAYIRTDFCKEMSTYTEDPEFEAELNRKGFPESYKPGLRDLHANYPNWVFTLYRTGLNFDYAVDNEMVGTKNLVTAGAISSFKSTEQGKYDWTTSKWPTFDGNAWVCASREAVRCYMDPRNFLYDPYIFQFESQTFNPYFHTIDGINEMVKGTFLDGKVETGGLQSAAGQSSNIITMPGVVSPNTMPTPDMLVPNTGAAVIIPILMGDKKVEAFTNTATIIGPGAFTEQIIESSFPYTYLPKGTYTYSQLIYDACRQVNANPYVIISMILQEQGKNGTESISGNNKKFKNIYNYGNVNAYASDGFTAIENGLKYAAAEGSYNRPWNTKEKGIYGLCDFYANSYVNVGQDTFYLKKWNVQGQNMFKHQYMSNITGAASEGQLLGSSYDAKMLSIPHEFKIPYYEDMPAVSCPIPVKDGSPNNKLKNLEVSNYIITPTFNPDTNNYTLIVDQNVNSVFVSAEAYDKKAAIGGVGNIAINTSNTKASIYCVAENGDIREYTITIYKNGAENVAARSINEYQVPIIESLGPAAVINGNQSIQNTNNTQFFNNINVDQVIIGVGPGQ